MKILEKTLKESSKDLPVLTDYHWQKRQEGIKAVQEMLKHPYSFQQMKGQTLRNKKALEETAKKKF